MRSPVGVVTAQFEDLVALGLAQLIAEDENLEMLAEGVALGALENAIERHSPAVVVLNFGSLASPASVFQLHQACPDTRLVVLANRPTAAECNQMLSFGATACLSKETQGRDVVNAIHLASRGMHVLPRSAAGGRGGDSIGLDGSDLLTPREADVLELLQEGSTNAQIAHLALDRPGDRANPRAQHLPQARHLLPARSGPDRPAGDHGHHRSAAADDSGARRPRASGR